MEIKSALLKKITAYCKVNGIADVEGYINDMLEKSFMVEQYGSMPFEKMLEKKAKITPKTSKKEVVGLKSETPVTVSPAEPSPSVVKIEEKVAENDSAKKSTPIETTEKKKSRVRTLSSR